MGVFDINNLMMLIALAEIKCFVKDLLKKINPYFQNMLLMFPKLSILPRELRRC